MTNKLTEKNIRAGERRAYRLFRTKLAAGTRGWIPKNKALGYRGEGREMIRSLYAVARHIEGARLSRSLAKRGIDTVSLSAVRTALRRITDGLIKRTDLREASNAGKRLARFISRTK